MGKMNNESMITQQEEWDNRWNLRIIELVKEYPNYSSDEIAELVELEQQDAINEYEQEKALDNADSWELPFAENH
tara:strand:+ start:757 stop:981 length:225 start_codon:yes stop_codon:yes gene_type:complete